MSIRYNGRPPPPPPKKSSAGLIIGIIVAVVVIAIIIIVIVLVLRSRSNSNPNPPVQGCSTDSDCTGTAVCDSSTSTCVECLNDTSCSGSTPACNTATKTCVACMTNANCTGGKICDGTTKTCITPQCVANTDCTSDPGRPACASGECKQCTVNVDCINNPLYADQNKMVCNPNDNTCVGCVDANDCGGAPNTCDAGVCCSKPAPTITSVTGTISDTSTIVGTFNVAGNLPGSTVKQIVQLKTDGGRVLYTSPQLSAAAGAFTLQENPIGVFLYPNTAYAMSVKLVYACGESSFSPDFSFVFGPSTQYSFGLPNPPTPGSEGPSQPVSAGGPPQDQSVHGPQNAGATTIITRGPPSDLVELRVIFSKDTVAAENFHPNNAFKTYTNLEPDSVVCGPVCGAVGKFATWNVSHSTPAPNLALVSGQQVWFRFAYETLGNGRGITTLSNVYTYTYSSAVSGGPNALPAP